MLQTEAVFQFTYLFIYLLFLPAVFLKTLFTKALSTMEQCFVYLQKGVFSIFVFK